MLSSDGQGEDCYPCHNWGRVRQCDTLPYLFSGASSHKCADAGRCWIIRLDQFSFTLSVAVDLQALNLVINLCPHPSVLHQKKTRKTHWADMVPKDEIPSDKTGCIQIQYPSIRHGGWMIWIFQFQAKWWRVQSLIRMVRNIHYLSNRTWGINHVGCIPSLVSLQIHWCCISTEILKDFFC